jgi:hypothetical protein
MLKIGVGREVSLAGDRLTVGEPVGQVFDAISQADTRSTPPAASFFRDPWARLGGGLSRCGRSR